MRTEIANFFSGSLLNVSISKTFKAEVSADLGWIFTISVLIFVLFIVLKKIIGLKWNHDVELEVGLGDI